jgi:hypothetical protein
LQFKRGFAGDLLFDHTCRLRRRGRQWGRIIDTAGNDTAGNDTTGNDTTGNDTTGNDTTGNDTASNDTAGNDTAGNDTASNDTASNDTASNDNSRSCQLHKIDRHAGGADCQSPKRFDSSGFQWK